MHQIEPKGLRLCLLFGLREVRTLSHGFYNMAYAKSRDP